MSVVEPQAGWAELAAGRWQDARASFACALDEHETAESWEGLSWAGLSWEGLSWAGLSWAGLSWAAWWLDDAMTVFEARERAYRGLPRVRRARRLGAGGRAGRVRLRVPPRGGADPQRE